MAVVEKTIHYTDLDGNPARETYHFQLGKSELAEMKLLYREDLSDYFKHLVRNRDGAELIRVWKDLLLRAVGKRAGNRLVKNQDIIDEFVQTGAYEELFVELIQSEDGGSSFFLKLMPESMQEEIANEMNRRYSDEEKLAMSDEEFERVVGSDPSKMSKHDLALAMRRQGHVSNHLKKNKKRRPASA